jgi:hypothetical protein
LHALSSYFRDAALAVDATPVPVDFVCFSMVTDEIGGVCLNGIVGKVAR